MKLALKWGIKFIRLPYENIRISIKGPTRLSMRLLNCLCWRKREQLQGAGLGATDYFFGSSFSGALTKEALLRIISSLPVGITEIMCHPGRDNPELPERYGWRLHWKEELEALTSLNFIDSLKLYSVELTNYRRIRDKKRISNIEQEI
jgi:predicted glycoside hydrolase/deacetylase ChbG (UPF0249 family)